MYNKTISTDAEIPVGELRQQIEYARIISTDLFNLFAVRNEKNPVRTHEYSVICQKLSMILDFLFQSGLWCDVIEEGSFIPGKDEI